MINHLKLAHLKYQDMNVSHDFLQETINSLTSRSNELIIATKKDTYTHPDDFVQLPFDEKMHHECIYLAQQKKKLKPELIILIGIGGSNLGALALYNALKTPSTTPLVCIDALDSDALAQTIEDAQKILSANKIVVLVVITKSGTTTETVAQAAIFIELFKEYNPKTYKEFIIFITDHDSALWHIGKTIDCDMLTLPSCVGGRYSVFSAVGLFPLALVDINIEELCYGARNALNIDHQTHTDTAAIRASLIWYHYQSGIPVHDTFIFDKKLIMYGNWYRQLIAESLGKVHNNKHEGILPTVSLGTTDLHSMIQLYLAGPHIRSTTFIAPYTQHAILINSSVLPAYNGHTIHELNNTIYQSVYNTYVQQKCPCMAWTTITKDAYTLGYLMQINMLETLYLAHLMDVNPFDQPAVEWYKKEARVLLHRTNSKTT